MILKEQHELDQKPTGKAVEAAQEARELDIDSPPPYAPTAGPSSNVSPAMKASNYVSVHRINGSIKSTYLLDPTLSIPPAMLPSQSFFDSLSSKFEGKQKRNLDLQSTNGPIAVDVTIPPVDNAGKKVLMYTKTINGNIELKLHRSTSFPAVIYEAYNMNGHVRLALPRSFHGPIFATTRNGQLKPSPEISSHMTSFSDVKGTNRFFVGDVRRYMEMKGENWEGDECILETFNGHVKICFEDEVAVQEEWASSGCIIM